MAARRRTSRQTDMDNPGIGKALSVIAAVASVITIVTFFINVVTDPLGTNDTKNDAGTYTEAGISNDHSDANQNINAGGEVSINSGDVVIRTQNGDITIINNPTESSALDTSARDVSGE